LAGKWDYFPGDWYAWYFKSLACHTESCYFISSEEKGRGTVSAVQIYGRVQDSSGTSSDKNYLEKVML
jgi:hypothetical protein